MFYVNDPEEAQRLAEEAQRNKRPATAIITPGMSQPPKQEPQPEPKTQQPPPPPNLKSLTTNKDLAPNQAENRATALDNAAPHNPYPGGLGPEDEASRAALRERHKEDYEYAKANYHYDPETGSLFSKVSGRLLRSTTGDKKRKVVVFRTRKMYQHDLAYLLMVGHWPEEPLNHVGDTLDNSWNNLRLRSQWTPQAKPTTFGNLTNEDIEAKAASIPKHVLEGRRYPLTVREIVDLYEFRAEGKEGVLISKRTGKEIAKPKTNSKGRHRVVFVTGALQIRAHIISYVLYHRKFPKGNLGARDGNKCNIHPSNIKPLWAERDDAS